MKHTVYVHYHRGTHIELLSRLRDVGLVVFHERSALIIPGVDYAGLMSAVDTLCHDPLHDRLYVTSGTLQCRGCLRMWSPQKGDLERLSCVDCRVLAYTRSDVER